MELERSGDSSMKPIEFNVCPVCNGLGKVFIANTLIQTPCTSCDGSGKARK
jgi:DnaJ-class molecular chaperone